ncbi:hypothetical protein Tco_0874666 [Tanacetum coccineum]|uniref:Uncharacterized protein n=1 Tax=Tanacetum coccineum TaxID=301880 RepID=A0ABQ5BM89_9ASTR
MHMKEVIKTYQQSSSNLLSLVEMLKEANVHGLMHTLKAIQNAINTQVDHHDTLAESYRSLAYNVGPRLTKIKLSQESIRSNIASLKANTSNIKEIVIVMFYAFKVVNSTHIVSNSPFVPSHEPSLERQIMVLITHDELYAHLDKKEKMEQAAKEAELSKLDIMKVAAKLVNEAEVQI